jgi:transposase
MNQRSLCIFEVSSTAYNTEKYLHFIDRLLSIIDAENQQNAVIVCDNVPFHHSLILVNTITSRGHEILFLPPYCPFLNPIEELFSQWKHWVTDGHPSCEQELYDLINSASDRIISYHCKAYYRHMEEYLPRCIAREVIN